MSSPPFRVDLGVGHPPSARMKSPPCTVMGAKNRRHSIWLCSWNDLQRSREAGEDSSSLLLEMPTGQDKPSLVPESRTGTP